MKNREKEMGCTELNSQLIETRLCARALTLAIRGHFSAASEEDGEVLESLALRCVEELDVLLDMSATVSVVLAAVGPKKIDVMKEVRAFTGLGLKEVQELVEAAPPTIIKQGVAEAEANSIKHALESVGATVMLI
jgi:ribosomal protein L7/L12